MISRTRDEAITLDEWHELGSHFGHRGHRIFYAADGSGDAILLIHGFPTASWDWHRIWPFLGDGFRLVAPDLIGFGFSAKPRPYDYSIVDQATLCETLMEVLAIRRVHVLAHDYGVSVAQELLARLIERRRSGVAGLELASICFLNGGLVPEAHRARPIQRLLAGRLGPWLAPLMNERRFRASFAAVFGADTQPSREELHDAWRLVSYSDGRKVVPALLGYMREREEQRERWVGALVHSPIPLRLVNGEADPVSGGHVVTRYRALVPDADYVVLPGIGHYPQLEDPRGVLRALRSFLDRVGQSGARAARGEA